MQSELENTNPVRFFYIKKHNHVYKYDYVLIVFFILNDISNFTIENLT